jgi:hypothetical protein
MIGQGEELYTFADVTRLLKLRDKQNRFVTKEVKRGALLAIDLGYNRKRVSSNDLSRYLANHKTNEATIGRAR